MNLLQLTNHPELMNKATLYELRCLTALYPYYQPARLLLLQNLYLLHDTSFDEELCRAAIYLSDRKTIFDIVEAAHYKLRKNNNDKEALTETTTANNNESDRTTTLIDSFLDAMPQEEEPQEKVKRRKPTPADAAVDYMSYLVETENSGSEETEQQTPRMKGQSLIDDFINNEGGKMQLKDEPEYLPKTDEFNDEKKEMDEGYFTETLAKIYIKQGRYSKALEIIERLNLNYPKKNAYFADQLRFLKKLIINNNTNINQK